MIKIVNNEQNNTNSYIHSMFHFLSFCNVEETFAQTILLKFYFLYIIFVTNLQKNLNKILIIHDVVIMILN